MRQPTIIQLVLAFTFATTASAFFRLPCKSPLVVQRADPVVSPGKVSSHAHTIMGGNGFGYVELLIRCEPLAHLKSSYKVQQMTLLIH